MIEQLGPYDAIFCMAVLQRSPSEIVNNDITNIRQIYPFSKFERQIDVFTRCLNKDGLLVLHHTQYLLSNTSMGSRFVTLNGVPQEEDFVNKFDKNCDRMETPVPIGSIFIKKI
jgi:hypothetical protein